MLRSIFLVLYYCALIVIAGIIFIPYTLITRNAEMMYRAAMRVAYSGVRLVGVKVRVQGREKLDASATYIFMSNHVSNLDPPIVVPLLPRRTSVLVKKEVFRIPILSTAMRLGSLVPVDRSNREAAIDSVHRAAAVLDSGINMTVFPEGTRSADGRLLPFKKGPFHLAMESGVAVVPVTISGTEKLMPKGEWRIRPGTVNLIFHAPISPAGFIDREQLMAAVREQIRSGLPEEMR